VERIFRVALSVFFILGVLGTSIMFFFAKPLARMMDSEASYLCIMAISPTLFFICISSAMRGYFQGHQNMVPTAVSEITEAIGKFAIGIALGYYAISRGESIEIAAGYAIAGITIGVAMGMLFLVGAKILYNSKHKNVVYDELEKGRISTRLEILRQMLIIALPITVSSVALNLTGIIDTFSIINNMSQYMTKEMAEAAYGNYSTLAVTMAHLPSAFIQPIASSLTPALTASLIAVQTAKTMQEKEQKKYIADKVMHSCLKFAAIIAIPCAVGMSVLSKPILGMLFNNPGQVASVNSAAPLLSILSIGVFFTAMLTITTAILQAHKLQKKPIISMFCGIAVKLILNICLIRNPSVGIYGAPIGTVACYFTMALVNFYFVIKYVGIKVSFLKNFIKPLIATLMASIVTVATYWVIQMKLSSTIATCVSILMTVIVYFILLFLMKTFQRSDIIILPKGEKIYRFLLKHKLIQ
jgi:stage V sporulation protein B